jgi:very-short-patch-repair endonuclease
MKTNPAIASAFFRTMGLPAPVTEHKFHDTRRWRFDYAWTAERVALEVEGGIFMACHGKKSRHSTGTGMLADMEKYNNAAALGWIVLRVTPQNLMRTETALLIKSAIENR